MKFAKVVMTALLGLSFAASLIALLLAVGWVGSPWTRIFVPPASSDGKFAFFIIWIVIIGPWALCGAWVMAKRHRRSAHYGDSALN